MSGFISFASGGASQPGQPNNSYESIGQGATGGQTTLTGGGTNAKGAYVLISSGIANDWAEMTMEFGPPSATTAGMLVDVAASLGTATITIASPGVVTLPSGHGLAENAKAMFTTSGALPTGLSAEATYYVKGLSGNTCSLSLTRGGSAINTTGSQSGTHTIHRVIVPNYFITGNNSTTGVIEVLVPLKGVSGAAIRARVQGSSGSPTLPFSITGTIANTSIPVGFSALDDLLPDLTNTRAGTVDVPLTNVWTELINQTAADYGGLMVALSFNGTALTSTQTAEVSIGTGLSTAEVALRSRPSPLTTTSTYVVRQNWPVIKKSLPATTRLVARANASATGDNIRVGVHGLVA